MQGGELLGQAGGVAVRVAHRVDEHLGRQTGREMSFRRTGWREAQAKHALDQLQPSRPLAGWRTGEGGAAGQHHARGARARRPLTLVRFTPLSSVSLMILKVESMASTLRLIFSRDSMLAEMNCADRISAQ